jgi:hypothetical protein
MTSTLTAFERPLLDEPLVVLSYAYSGLTRLRRLIEDVPALDWISTDLVRACDQVAGNWRDVEERGDGFSRMAQTSIRQMFSSMVMTRLAASGAVRYCFASDGSAQMAQRFAVLFPKAKFLCLHRTLLDVTYTAVQANPWGLNGSPCTRFTPPYPGNSVAAAAAYWVRQTEQLLAVERLHPDRVLRVKYEELDASPADTANAVSALLGVTGTRGAWPTAGVTGSAASTPVGCGAAVPVDRIPPSLVAEVNGLLAQLGYAPLSTAVSPNLRS